MLWWSCVPSIFLNSSDLLLKGSDLNHLMLWRFRNARVYFVQDLWKHVLFILNEPVPHGTSFLFVHKWIVFLFTSDYIRFVLSLWPYHLKKKVNFSVKSAAERGWLKTKMCHLHQQPSVSRAVALIAQQHFLLCQDKLAHRRLVPSISRAEAHYRQTHPDTVCVRGFSAVFSGLGVLLPLPPSAEGGVFAAGMRLFPLEQESGAGWMMDGSYWSILKKW